VGRVLRASIAPFLLLITPFVIFVQHQRYGPSHPEVLLVLLALTAAALLLGAGAARSHAFEVVVIAGLLILFADIQLDEPGEKRLLIAFVALGATLWFLRQHAARIVSLMVATMLAVSVLTPQSNAEPVSAAGAPAASPNADLPFILHVILDEHIGVEGLPADLAPPAFRRDFQSFFVQRGFRLFGRAYSEYPATLWSLAQLLNLAPNGYTPGLTIPGKPDGTFRLTRSAYFDRLSKQGYTIRVYRPEYLDMCTEAVPASACHTYPANSLRALDALPVPTHQKVAVVAGAYLSRSELHTRAKRTYMGARQRVLGAGIPLPAWDWERGGTSAPLGTMPIFDRIAADLSRARRGELVFAHLLMPHYPYVFGAGCEPRPPREWLERSDAVDPRIPGGITNSPDSRAARYARYLDQILCTQRKIDQLLSAVPALVRRDAIVIIQGDHGSRISLVEPDTSARGSLVTSDYADYFSTLFAVRAPALEPGYDTRVTPITCLLRSLAHSDFRSIGEIEACSTSPVVHFWDGMAPPRPRPLPEFWDRSSPSARRH
jgi:hypothetical protein